MKHFISIQIEFSSLETSMVSFSPPPPLKQLTSLPIDGAQLWTQKKLYKKEKN